MSAPARTHSVTPTVTPATTQTRPAAESQSGDGGKRMFRRMNGEMIELPADMSVFEAVRLEMEAMAAEKKHGKGQQPKPLKPKTTVVSVQAAAAKAAQKAKPKSKTDLKGKKGKGGKKAGGAKNPLQAAAKGKVGKFLAMLGGPVLLRGVAKLAQLKANEQTHDDPLTKLGQTEKAVVPPALEGQSKSHGEQVEALNQKPAPEPKAEDASKAMLDSIQANMPQTIEDVDNFKRNGKGGHIGRTVMNMVQGHTNSVTDTFGEMDKPRPPAPPTHTPETLPPEEIAPATPNLQLGAGAIAPLKPEHTDMSKFSKDSDDLLKKEEISQEQLDMVDSGDLAEANKDRKQLKKDVNDKPAAARKTAEHERKQVDTELQQEEQKGRGEIKNKRKQSLAATRGRQTGTKLTMQQKRQKVTDDIKAIYDKARNKVTARLAELETQSMKRFDDGNAVASKKFEDDVKREIEAFKDRRYSGFWGWAKKAKDWLLGMDELPEVNEIFQRNKGIFVDTMNTLVADITADNKKVIAECKAEIEGAKTEIAKYVKNLDPELKAEGESAMKEMTDKLNELDKEVEEKEKELAQKLKDKQAAAIKAIDEKIEKMKEEMSGALAKLGKLLLEAAKKFFTWALQKFGYSLSEIEGIINKGAKVLKAIFTKPIQFVKNLFNAADQGFSNFGKNFLTHLKNALFSWLTGSLTEVKLPESWDPKGIASVALQMVGISYQNIRKHLVKIIPEPVVEGMEKGFEIVKALITDGPMAAWEALKDMAGELKDAFVDAVKSWIKETIIMKAIEFVASLIIPGAGIIRAIVGIYDTIVFFIQKAKDIAQMIGNFMGSIGEIAMGNIGAAAGALENGLAQGLTLVISFLAKLIKLDGITAKIRAALAKIKDKVDGMMSKVAKWIKEKAGKLFGRDKANDSKSGADDEKDPSVQVVKNAVKEVEAKANSNNGELPEDSTTLLTGIKNKYKLKDLRLEKGKDGFFNVHGEVNPRFTGDLELLSDAQRKELKREVPRFVDIITRPENNDRAKGKNALIEYRTNPVEFLSTEGGPGSTIVGGAVESLSLVSLKDELKNTPEFSILESVRMAPIDISGNNLKPNSHQNEIDFLILGNNKIQKIVSAKANHARVDVKVEHNKISLINGFPNHAGPDKMTQYSNKYLDYAIKRDNDRKEVYDVFGAILLFTEDRDEKTMGVDAFKSRYLNRVKVDKIEVEGRALSPADPTEFVRSRTKTLGITKSRLIPILAEYINRHLK
jgi:hypothetical protein